MAWLKKNKKDVEARLEPLTGKLEPLSPPQRPHTLGAPEPVKAKPATLGTVPAMAAIPGVEVGEEERGTEIDLRERLVYTASPLVPVPDVPPAPAPAKVAAAPQVTPPPAAQDLITPTGEQLPMPDDTRSDEAQAALDAQRLAAQEQARQDAQRRQDEQVRALFARPAAPERPDVQISLSIQALPFVDTTRKPGYARETTGQAGVVFAVQAWFPQTAKLAPTAPAFTPATSNVAVQVPAAPSLPVASEPTRPAVAVTSPAAAASAAASDPGEPVLDEFPLDDHDPLAGVTLFDLVDAATSGDDVHRPVTPAISPAQPVVPEVPSAPAVPAPPPEADVIPLASRADENYILSAEHLLSGPDDHVQAIDRGGQDVSDEEQLRALLAEEARRGIQEASQRAYAQERTPDDTLN